MASYDPLLLAVAVFMRYPEQKIGYWSLMWPTWSELDALG